MPLFNPAVIGGPLPGATAGSVLFAGTGGVFAQSANLFWDDSAKALGLGTLSIDASAQLQGVTTTKGWAPPRWTTAERDAIPTPLESLFGYNLTTQQPEYYDGVTWGPFVTGGSGMAIGDPVTGGTTGSVLFVDGSGDLGEDNAKFFWDDTNYWLGVGTIPETALHVSFDIGGTVNPDTLLALDSISSNTVGDGFGGEILWRLQDAGGTLRNAALDTVQWRTAAAGTRKADRVFTVYDDTAAREALRLSTDGTVPYAILAGEPPASATRSKLQIGNALTAGSANGTGIGVNFTFGYTGHLMNLSVNNQGKFVVYSDGSATVGADADLYKLTVIGAAKNAIYHAVLATSPVAGDSLFYGAVTGTVVGDINAFSCLGSCQGNLGVTFYNTLAHVDAHAVFDLQVLSGASGDPKLRFSVATVGNGWALGLDNSDADKFKLVAHYYLDAVVPSLTIDRNSLFGINTDSPAVRFHVVHDSAFTNTVDVVEQIDHNTSGTPAAGFGSELRFRLESSTTPNRDAGGWRYLWNDATDATRKTDVVGTVWDTAEREWIRGRASGSAPMVGFLGATPVVRDTGWTLSNVTTDRTFDANATTLDELADVVGPVINALITNGLFGT